MIIATTTTITLDPVTEIDVAQQYAKDKNYKRIIDSKDVIAFRYEWPSYRMGAVYMPLSEEGQHERQRY